MYSFPYVVNNSWYQRQEVHTKMKKIKAVALVLIMILCGAAFARGMQVEAKANAVQEKLSGEVFRFHVLANSDSKEDQELKMKVKEAVVDYMCENLSDAGNAAEAKAWAIRHKEELIRTAREVLQEEGCNDQITAEVVRCEFPDKTYGDIIFPAAGTMHFGSRSERHRGTTGGVFFIRISVLWILSMQLFPKKGRKSCGVC